MIATNPKSSRAGTFARNKRLTQLALNGLLGLVLLVMLFPFAWMILTAFRNQAQNTSPIPVWFFVPTLENFSAVIVGQNFLRYTLNSFIVASAATGLGLLLGLPAAYAIARYRLRGLAAWILISRIIPYVTFLLPWFLIFTQLKLTGTFTALILMHLIITLPMIIWVMIAFFEDIPVELEEAALIDGLTRFGAFRRIAVPLVAPGVATATILSFIYSWNQFLFSLILAGPDTKTVPVAVFNFISYGSINFGGIAAAAVLITLPVVVLTLFVQRHILRGLTGGGVKG
jgi:multiple sugar transport system permease protein